MLSFFFFRYKRNEEVIGFAIQCFYFVFSCPLIDFWVKKIRINISYITITDQKLIKDCNFERPFTILLSTIFLKNAKKLRKQFTNFEKLRLITNETIHCLP